MSDLSWLNPTPHAIAVYASQPLSPVATQHSPPSGRYSLTWAGLPPAGSHQLAAGALIRSPRRRGQGASAALGGREFLFLVADIPDADYFARCVLNRVITGHVQLAEDVDFAVESLTFVDIHYRFSLRVQDGPKRPALYA